MSAIDRDIQALRSEEPLIRFISCAPIAAAMFDCNMRYLAASPRWFKDYGLEGEIRGRSHYQIFPEIPERWKAFHRRALAGEVLKVDEDVFERENGTTQWLAWEIRPWQDKDGDIGGIVMFTEDITKLKQSEMAYIGAERRLKVQLDAMVRMQALAVRAFPKIDLTLILEDILDTSIAISGADAGNIQILDTESGDLVIMAHRGFPKWWLKYRNKVAKGHGACGTALESGKRIIVEDVEKSPLFIGARALKIQLKAGIRAVQSTPLIDRSGRPIGMFSTHYRKPHRPSDLTLQLLDFLARQASDLIERVNIENSLRLSEQRMSALLNALPVGVSFSNDATCRHITGNPAVLAQFEAPGNDNLSASAPNASDYGRRIVYLSDGHPINDKDLPLQRAVTENRLIPPVELDIRLPNGRRRYAETSAAPIHDVNNEVVGGVAVTVDITERKLYEAKLADQARQLHDANQQKDQFLAMLAHELRNPMTPIRNAVQILKLADIDPARIKWGVDIIDRQSRHLVELVDDLLDVSRISRGLIEFNKEPLEIREFILPALESCQPLIDTRRQNLSLDLPEEQLWLEGDRIRLTQVVSNLLNNASKYTREGGQIGLSVESSENKVIIRVSDKGCGIDSKDISQLFNLFYQADQALDRLQGGLGIGLSLVRSIVEKHGGEVKACSAGRGQGSEFTVRLTRMISPEPKTAGAASQKASESGKLILLVDDNRDISDSLSLLLERHGHRVIVANDGSTALVIARAERPDAIILDIGLPGMDGYQVAFKLRQSAELMGTLLIAFSGYGQPSDREKSKAAGFDAHLVKPDDIDVLCDLLSNKKVNERL